MGRIEELCNVVVFYVTDWRAMEAELGLEPWPLVPSTATVTVTRRGTLTMRITHGGVPWHSNEPYLSVTRAMAAFVRGLV